VLLCEKGRQGQSKTARVLEREGRGSEGDKRKTRQDERKESEKREEQKKEREREEQESK